MAEFNSPFEVGAAQSFGASWAPCNGSIGTNSSNWNYGGGCAYPAPYRSFSQNLINGSHYLGPYGRRLDGVAVRMKMSISAHTGEMGCVQQCWYDFPRGSNDKVDGVLADTNKVWWDTKVSKKHWIRVWDLNDDAAPLVWVQVAIAAGTTSYPELSMHDDSNGPLQGECIRHIRAGHNAYGGIYNPVQLYTGVAGNCGMKSDSISELAIPYNAGLGRWLPDVSFLENGGFAGCPYVLDPDAEAKGELDTIYGSLSSSQEAEATDFFAPENIVSNLADAVDTHKDNVKDFLDNLSDYVYNNLQSLSESELAAWIKKSVELLAAAPMAGDLMIQAWWLPNLRKYGSGNGVTGTASNPYKWRPPDHVQQRFASYFNDNGTTGAPLGTYGDFRDYIPSSTPLKAGSTTELDQGWFLTLLNRGDPNTVPVVDSDKNEFVFHENYGFNRGGSVSSADDFLDWVGANFGNQTRDSVGALIDMSPGTLLFVPTLIPILTLEAGGRLIKVKKGETPGVTNLDGYDDTKFEIRISAKNLKAGNPTMYNYLVNTGDANGNKLTPVP